MKFNKLLIVKILAAVLVALALLAVLVPGVDEPEAANANTANAELIPAETVLKVGENCEFKVAENQTTGYCWQLLSKPDSCKVEIKHEPSTSDLAGAPGEAIVVITGVEPGKGIVSIGYLRPWEDGVAPIEVKNWGIAVME